MKRVRNSFIAFSMTAVLAVGSLGAVQTEAAVRKPKKITMNAATVLVKVKGKTALKVKSVTPAKASRKVTFQSARKKIATVNAKGVVTGKKAGTTKITVTSKVNKKVKATVKVIVVKKVPAKVVLNKKNLSLTKGATAVLKATVTPAKAYSKGGTWTSSNKKVAAVSGNGKVTAKAAGTAKITYTTLNGKKATCKVTVTENVQPTTAPTTVPTTVPTTTPAATATPPAVSTDAPSRKTQLGGKTATAYTVAKDTSYTIHIGTGDTALVISSEQMTAAFGSEITAAAAESVYNSWNDVNKVAIEKKFGNGTISAGERKEDGSRTVTITDISADYNGSYDMKIVKAEGQENIYVVEAKALTEGREDKIVTVAVNDSENKMTIANAGGDAVASVKTNPDGSRELVFTDDLIAKNFISVKVPAASAQ